MGGVAWIVAALIQVTSGQSGQSSCEEITIPMCRGIGYNYTRMPNQLNHQTQDEAGLEVHQFWPLVEIQCSPDLRFFLCSMYAPICIETYLNPLPACRSVCERARLGCVPLMQQYGFAWPKRMACDKLPQYGGKDLCMDSQEQDAEARGVHITGPQYTSPRYKKPMKPLKPFGGSKLREHSGGQCQCFQCGLHGNFIQPRDDDLIEGDPNRQQGGRLVHLRPGDQYYNQSFMWAGQSDCVAPCYSPYFSKSDRDFTELWLAIWSIICFISTAITFITFLTDPARFCYPERPIMFISFCYLFISVGFLIRVSVGHEAVSCQYQKNGQVPSFENQLISRVDLESTSPESIFCTTVFVLVYFFWMASSVWWVVLTFTWFLSAGLKWAHESISHYSPWYHILAWIIPMVQTMLALLTSSVDGDPVSGLCHIKNQNKNTVERFIIVPLLIYLTLGIIFLSAGFISLFRVRSIIKAQVGGSKIDKLEKLMVKIGIFGGLYIVPAGSLISINWYEAWHVESWEKTLLCPSCLKKHLHSRPDFSVLMLKQFMMMAVGITSAFWIWSGKTLDSWSSCFSQICACCSRHGKGSTPSHAHKLPSSLPPIPAQVGASQQTLHGNVSLRGSGHYSVIPLNKQTPLTHV